MTSLISKEEIEKRAQKTKMEDVIFPRGNHKLLIVPRKGRPEYYLGDGEKFSRITVSIKEQLDVENEDELFELLSKLMLFMKKRKIFVVKSKNKYFAYFYYYSENKG